MKQCPNCEAKLLDETKFCTKCGTQVDEIINNQNDIEKNDDILIEKSLNQPNKGLRITKVLIGIVVLTVLFYIGKSFISNTEISEPLFDIDEEVAKIEGNWFDPTGVLLNDKTAIIKFKSIGSISEGNDENNSISISMIPTNKNRYYATVNLKGVKGEFDATFDANENKLVFFSTLTKSSWYLIKLKN